MFKLIKQKNKFGIKENSTGELVITFCHEDPRDAVDEWKLYQHHNTEVRQFLKTKLTLNQIKEEHTKLLSQLADFQKSAKTKK